MGEPREPRWVVVVLDVDSDDVDVVSGELWAAGVSGVEERDRTGGVVRLVASVDEAQLDRVMTVATSRAAEARALDVGDGESEQQAPWARPVPVGRLLIIPAGLPDESSGGEVVVRIDPGRSFGWGGHVTTRLALEMLQDHLSPGEAVLDVGTGSGVLAISAARLGAARVTAVDIDADACAAARRNIVLNGIRDHVEVIEGPLDPAAGPFDLVLANLDRPALTQMAPLLRRVLAPAGRLVVTGFLTQQEPSVLEAFGDLAFTQRREEGEWAALAGTHVRGDLS